ncbi:MAG: OadG family transporter subunit [Bacteroidales bacterium]|nr:OadG family transporter subunit [Bacteroidales bacterium]
MISIKAILKAWKFVFIVMIFVLGINETQAQSGSDLKINEILVYNDSSCVDDFGMHSSWIEIFNTAYNSVEIGGLYLTNDLSNPKKYYIPKGDPRTIIPPRGFIVFWADSRPTRGILHLNFGLQHSKTLALFDANGRTMIDVVKTDKDHKPNITYGRIEDGGTAMGFLDKNTPSASNDTRVKVTGAQIFSEMDPYGGGLAIIAMSVVFSALTILYFVFKNASRIIALDFKKLFSRKKKIDIAVTPKEDIPGEVCAAIAMALYSYRTTLHDIENTVLTIKKISKTYSPWSSKIYGLRKLPRGN